MNCKDGRRAAFEAIPASYRRSDWHERQLISEVSQRRTAPSVYSGLAIGANGIMQRQIGCISLHPKFQFRPPNANKLGREPRPRHPLDYEWAPRTGLSRMPLELTERVQALPPRIPVCLRDTANSCGIRNLTVITCTK